MPEPIKISLTGIEKASATVLRAVHEGVIAGLEAVGVQAVKQTVENIRKPYDGMPPAVSSGNLANRVFATVTPGIMLTRLLVQAGAPADTYADPVNFGARAHMPPVNALLPWVKMKFGVEDEKSALSIAWAIAISQAKKGMQGRHMFDRAQVEIDPLAPSIIERQIAVALRAAGVGGDVATA
jgi:hypothetical protein